METFHPPLTRRKQWKAILGLAWPLIIANSFWNLQITIDRIYLGSYSTEALAAAIAVMGVFWTPMALLQQTAAYLTTFVAQFYGAKRMDRIGPAVWQSIYVSVIGGLLLLLMLPFSTRLFEFIGHSDSVRPIEIAYFDALCYSAMPAALVAAASSFFTGLGNTTIIMKINFVGLVVNVIFDYLMIFGKFGFPEMGAAGAGYATAVSNWVSAIYGLALVFRREFEAEYKVRSGWRWDGELMRRFLKFGVPSGLQWSLEGLAFTVFLIFVGRMQNGDAALASSGIVVTVMMLSILPAMGVAQAVSVLVGQYLGEKKPGLAEAATWSGFQVALMYIASVGVTFVLFPSFYVGWFHNPSNAALWDQVRVMVPYLLMFVAFFTLFDSMNLVFSFALKGAGDTRFVTLVALTLPWPLMVLPTWWIKDQPGAIYLAWSAASCYGMCQAGIFGRRFVGGKWKQMSVIG